MLLSRLVQAGTGVVSKLSIREDERAPQLRVEFCYNNIGTRAWACECEQAISLSKSYVYGSFWHISGDSRE